MTFRIGIDSGGTFTDAVSVDEQGNLVTAKSPTRPKDLAAGTIAALHALARANNMEPRDFLGKVTTFVHGTTMGTNILVSRTGSKLGVLVTQGQRDTLQLPKIHKTWIDLYDWKKAAPKPLVPRHLQLEIEERVGSRGEVVKALNEDSVRKAVAELKELGVDSIAVCLLFSFLRPEHERRVREIIKQDFPEAIVTLSHEILHAAGEYDRTNTTVIGAYVARSTAAYIRKLQGSLAEEGFKGQLLFMQNNGGVETADRAIEKPASLALSGPAAAPSAALTIGRLHGDENLLAVDMGGTSYDISIVEKGNFHIRTESMIDDLKFCLPVIDIATIGAGGGSIAWFDSSGVLRTGPKSAGSDPGPACYGTGGEEATITDANVVLGYISPDFFLGGQIKLRKDLSEAAMQKVADRMQMTAPQAAYAIHQISNAVMVDATNKAFSQKGYDPRDFVLVSAGGAAQACSLRIARELGMSRVLVPKFASIFCAFGMLCVDLRHDFARFFHADQRDLDINVVRKIYEEMEGEGQAILIKEGVAEKDRVLERSMRLKYWGTFRDLEVPWPSGPITEQAIAEGIANFHRKHQELYGSSNPEYPVEFGGFGLAAIGKMPKVSIKEIASGGSDASHALKGERMAYFEESNGFVSSKVYDGDKLLAGNVLEGPCLVEEKNTTLVIPPTFKMQVGNHGSYHTAA